MPIDDADGSSLPARLDPRAGRPRPVSHAARRADGAGGSHSAGAGQRPGRQLAVAARAVAAVLAVVILGGSGWGYYLASVAEASLARTDAIPTDGNSDDQGSGHAGQEMNLLLVGRDSRAGLTPEQQEEFSTGGPEGLLNTDSMMLVHIPADGSGASFVSIPRDLYVEIPGHDPAKLNSAFGAGYNDADGDEAAKDAAGARLLVQTISQVTGLQIDHYAEVNLLGFINLSNIVGGVEVNLCQATSDPNSGADFEAGVQTISGTQALQFVRQRDGLPRTDLDRQVRQQVFIAGMIRNLMSQNLLLDPGKQRAAIEQIGTSVTVDQGLNLLDLATQMQSVRLDSITFQTIPGLIDDRNEAGAVLVPISEDDLRAFFANLNAEPTPATETTAPTEELPAPSTVTVSVLNGSGVSGAAATAADALAGAGFVATSDGNAPAMATTTINYATGNEAQAAVLAQQIPGSAMAADDTITDGVQLVLGSDFNGIGQPVTVAAALPTDGSYAATERTADDTGCIA